MMLKEMNRIVSPKKCTCEDCGKITICYLQGYITPITRRLSYEKWLCVDCLD